MTGDDVRAEVTEAVKAFRAVEAAYEKARERVQDAFAAADAADDVTQVEVVRISGFSREHVRRLTRAGQDRASVRG